MIGSGCYLELRADDRIVQRRRNLADTAAEALDNFITEVRTCQSVAVFFRKWRYMLQDRKLFPRIQRRAADQFAAVGNVLLPCCVRSRIICCKCAQNRSQLLQLLCRSLRLDVFDIKINADVLAAPFTCQEIVNFVSRTVLIHLITVFSAGYGQLAV